MLTDLLCTTVKGVTTIRAWTEHCTSLSRHICDTPRARRRRSLDDLKTLKANYPALS